MNGRNPYVRKIPNTWFMQNLRYQKYMIRELSSVFLAIYTIIITVGIVRLAQGEADYNGWLAALASPGAVVFHLVTLALVSYHMVTWFEATPKAMPPLRMGGKKVPAEAIVRANYAVWAVVSIVILILAVVV